MPDMTKKKFMHNYHCFNHQFHNVYTCTSFFLFPPNTFIMWFLSPGMECLCKNLFWCYLLCHIWHKQNGSENGTKKVRNNYQWRELISSEGQWWLASFTVNWMCMDRSISFWNYWGFIKIKCHNNNESIIGNFNE